MGGPGSGRGYFRATTRKVTVEESLTISAGNFRNRLRAGAAGTLTWTWRDGSAAIGYAVGGSPEASRLFLRYTRGAEPVAVTVGLTRTGAGFGGRRWWFVCPLAVNGRACGRRVAKLHLPPEARLFGCRVCHRLSYRSSQEAHQAERVGAMLGLDPEAAKLFGKRWYSRTG